MRKSMLEAQNRKSAAAIKSGAGDMATADAMRDYQLVRTAVEFLSENWRDQPDLQVLADQLGLSQAHTQKLFKRWCGLSPKEFLQSITIDHARTLLVDSASLLETSFEVGLSGAGRLHDLFVDHEAMTPGDYKRRGEGVAIDYGFHPSQFGLALVMATGRGICGIGFADNDAGRADALADMVRRWPAAQFHEAPERTKALAARALTPSAWRADDPVRLVMIGSDFEVRVWQALLKIPMGRACTYSDIAAHVGHAGAARAVGSAVGRNPISFVVPCHRVMGKSGGLCGYHWGVTRKQAIIGWEKGQIAGG